MKSEFKLTLNNFDKSISSGMLKKGKDYYDDGAVLEIDEHKGKWTAEVEGTDMYTITVQVKNKTDIEEWFCDCPYDGDLCKHVVAVLFCIKEQIALQKTIPAAKDPKKLFDSVLSQVSLDESHEFIKHYASINKDFKTAFELYFAAKDDRIDIGAKYSDLIRKLIKKNSDRGFLDYRGGITLSKEVGKLLQDGAQLAHKKNYKDAFVIATVILKEMMQVITYCDDSSGSIGSTLYASTELIETIAEAEDVAPDMKNRIFDFLLPELNDKVYFDYGDFGYYIFSVFKNLAACLNRNDEYLQYLDLMYSKSTGEYEDYQRDFFKTEKIEFLNETGRTEEANQLIAENMDIKAVRQAEVDKAIAGNDLKKAKTLLNEGMRKAEADKLPGLANSWEKQLLNIAVIENDIPLVRWYCKKFAFDRAFENQYYNQWKATFTKEEWPEIVEHVIREIDEKTRKNHKETQWSPLNYALLQALAPLYITENYLDRLFLLVKEEKRLDVLMRFHGYLIADYGDELIKLYVPALITDADGSSNRDHYIQLTNTMKKIVDDIPAGKEAIKQTTQSLLVKYPRRPAMVEELNKLLKSLK
jgi:hypothetical protein